MTTGIMYHSLQACAVLLIVLNGMRAASPQKNTVQLGNDLGVGKIAVSVDGKFVAIACIVGDNDSEIRLLAAGAKQQLAKFSIKGHVTCIQFAPDSKNLLVGGTNKECIVWSTSDHNEIGKFIGHTDALVGISVSAKSDRVATSSVDKSIKIWDLATSKLLATLNTPKGVIHCIAYSPIGDYLVSGGNDKTVRIWNSESFTEQFHFVAHSAGVNCLTFLPSGNTIITASAEGEVKAWDLFLKTKTSNDRLTWIVGRAKPLLIVAHPNSKQVAIGLSSGEVMICFLSSDSTVAEMKLNSHKVPVTALAYSHDGNKLFVGSFFESYYSMFSDLP